jgi:cytochrome P450
MTDIADRDAQLPKLLEDAGGGPVTRVRAATGDAVWQVADYGLARQVLADRRFSRVAAVRPGAPLINTINPSASSMMSMDGAGHARLRRLVAGAFGPQRIAALAPDIQRLVDDLLDELGAAGPPADLIASFAAPLPVAVIGTLLGMPVEDRTSVQEWAGVLFDVTASTPRDKARRGFSLFAYMSQLVGSRLADRMRLDRGDDLIGSLIAAYDSGELSRTELVDLALAVLTAGYETTVGQLGLSALSLLRNPEQVAALQQPGSAAAVIEEYLRLTPATPMTFPRVASEDVDLGGVTIRAGDAVVVSVLHSNLDGAVFADPARLVPAGRAAAHLTFGYGPHFCLGARLARLQLNLALPALVRRMPGLRLADDAAAVGWCEGLAVRGLTRLLVTW